jgi:hypothetical protein
MKGKLKGTMEAKIPRGWRESAHDTLLDTIMVLLVARGGGGGVVRRVWIAGSGGDVG